ncbi:MAG: hypothetical protein AB7O39_16800 [Flavobacteriaceae bacterium]
MQDGKADQLAPLRTFLRRFTSLVDMQHDNARILKGGRQLLREVIRREFPGVVV